MTLLRIRPAPATPTTASAPPPSAPYQASAPRQPSADCQPSAKHPKLFQYGVGSADPAASAIIIWTLLTPPRSSAHPAFPVEWELSSDPQFRDDVRRGYASRGASEVLTVRANVCGLTPNTVYYYRFHAQADTSMVGRTRTGPAEQRPVPRPVLAFTVRHRRGRRRLAAA